MDSHVVPVPAPKNPKREFSKTNGSLSDGSVCELPPLNKVAFRRNQFQNPNIYLRQENQVPLYRPSGMQPRKRFTSAGDRDHTGSSGYETGSKKNKRDSTEVPIMKSYNPVMENRVTSTNNDVVYKFTGPTPAEDFQVTYTLEERVKAAAFAIVYNNCKISTDKFESLYDKPAPDFKTIFAWRQRLLATGCLVDSHVMDIKKDPVTTACLNNVVGDQDGVSKNKHNIQKLPNPDEIPIMSDSDDNSNKASHGLNKSLPFLQRSASAETVQISGLEKEQRATGSSISAAEERSSHHRSRSASTHQRTLSSSSDSQDSNYPDSDFEKLRQSTNTRNINTTLKSNTLSTKNSINNSDSESVSYNSEDENFLSRVFGEGRKRRKLKRRPAFPPPTKVSSYIQNNIQPFQGYSTVKPTEQSPLITGNIYTPNLHHMKTGRQDVLADTDGCSSEYVPTRLGSSAKRNYQEFRDNVKKKGYWAKGNGATISRNKPVQNDLSHISKASEFKTIEKSSNKFFTVENVNNNSSTQIQTFNDNIDDLSKATLNNSSSVQNNIFYDKPLVKSQPIKPLLKSQPSVKHVENNDRVFSVVQSFSVMKNRSITDIFSSEDTIQNNTDSKIDDLEQYDSVHKLYQSQWDDDDEALYKNSDSIDSFNTSEKQTELPSKNSPRIHSPVSSSLYATDKETLVLTPSKSTTDAIIQKRDMLLGLLKDFQITNSIGEIVSPLKQGPMVNQDHHSDGNTSPTSEILQIQNSSFENFVVTVPEPIPDEISNELLCMSQEQVDIPNDNIPNTKNPDKHVQVLESVTIYPDSEQNVQIPQIQNINLDQSTVTVGDAKSISLDPNPGLKPAVVMEKSRQSSPKPKETSLPDTTQQVDLTTLLAGINTNTLLLALQNLQKLTQTTDNNEKEEEANVQQENNTEECLPQVETINLTNDEDWEKESVRDDSIERQLKLLDGNTGDTPFLSDIFDPGPVVIPPNVAKKLNININNPDEDKDTHKNHLNENAPVIGNFKSFALPKPILLNRLKLTVKNNEKSSKKCDNKRSKRKIKVCITCPFPLRSCLVKLGTHLLVVTVSEIYV